MAVNLYEWNADKKTQSDHQQKLWRDRNKNQTWQIELLFPYLKLLKFVGKQYKQYSKQWQGNY